MVMGYKESENRGSFVIGPLAKGFLVDGSLADDSWAVGSIVLGSKLPGRDLLACWFFSETGSFEAARPSEAGKVWMG